MAQKKVTPPAQIYLTEHSPKAAVENVSAVIGPIAHGLGILRGEALDG